MELSVIHNVYGRNNHIRESVATNIKALEDSGIQYQYIIFNDCGDIEIEKDLENELKNSNTKYIYSDFNYGLKVQTGGWIGALEHIKGQYIHNTGQDDVFTPLFYSSLIERLRTPEIYLAYANGFMVDSSLSSASQTMGPLEEINYSDPKKIFDLWFGRQGNTLTRANNYIPAPGVIYNKKLHDIIGLPDFQQFGGSADFEYWSRVLFNGLGISYDPRPLWLYRRSKHSLGANPSFESKSAKWNNLILEKYQQLIFTK